MPMHSCFILSLCFSHLLGDTSDSFFEFLMCVSCKTSHGRKSYRKEGLDLRNIYRVLLKLCKNHLHCILKPESLTFYSDSLLELFVVSDCICNFSTRIYTLSLYRVYQATRSFISKSHKKEFKGKSIKPKYEKWSLFWSFIPEKTIWWSLRESNP